MLIENVLAKAQPCLAGKTVCDLIVGVALIACELDSGEVGVSYMLREDLPAGCCAFPAARQAVGKPAAEIAGWALSGRDNLLRGIGNAVLSAASQGQDLGDDDAQNADLFGIELHSDDTVAMIGQIAPLVARLEKSGARLLIFDEGQALRGNKNVHTMAEQPQLLPGCNVVILSGTTIINNSIDDLLVLCDKAREIVMVGSSTPMYPAGFAASGITRLAGSWWENAEKDKIFRIISLAGGINAIQPYMRKKLAVLK